MIKLEGADVHSPVFLNGKNLGQKLDPKKTTGLTLSYDDENKRLWIEYNGKACFFGIEGAIHPLDPSDFGYKMQAKLKKPDAKVFTPAAQVANVSQTAQIETPMQRVQQPPSPRSLK